MKTRPFSLFVSSPGGMIDALALALTRSSADAQMWVDRKWPDAPPNIGESIVVVVFLAALTCMFTPLYVGMFVLPLVTVKFKVFPELYVAVSLAFFCLLYLFVRAGWRAKIFPMPMSTMLLAGIELLSSIAFCVYFGPGPVRVEFPFSVKDPEGASLYFFTSIAGIMFCIAPLINAVSCARATWRFWKMVSPELKQAIRKEPPTTAEEPGPIVCPSAAPPKKSE